MPDFNDIRIQLQQARQQQAEQEKNLLLAKEALKRVNAAESELNRVFDAQNEQHRARRDRIEQEKKKWGSEIQKLKDEKTGLRATVDARFAEFLFAEPQEQVRQLSDDTPFLLFPVRIETRFKTVATRSGGQANELWVRIFPDDCVVDTFEEELSESEIKSAREFWAGMWKAGGVRAQEQAAWRSLVASHGSGRAAWIIKDANAAPQNPLDKPPAKVKETDIILAIPADADLAPNQKAALEPYWKTTWLADGNRAQTDAAFTTLTTTLGINNEQAAALLKKYQPVNFLEKPAPPLTKSEVALSAVFVIFKKPEELIAKQTSWTRAPKVNLLPDRFVLMLDDGIEVTEHVGRAIPAPLTVGVDPSADEDDQLRQEDGDMKVSEEMKWMVDFERAIEWGMGFKIGLTDTQAKTGFRRVTALGLRLSTDAQEGKILLEELFKHHQFGKSGFSLLPQGIPTNNVESQSSGHSTSADGDADATFDIYLSNQDQFALTGDWATKRDGQWLAEWLGISPTAFQRSPHAGGKDQCHARAMNTALWPATLGYLMDTMMRQVFDANPESKNFDDDAVLFTRWFFTHFVSGRGAVPAIRIGRQPYGILPATNFSKMDGFKTGHIQPPRGISLPETWQSGMSELYRILSLMQNSWHAMSTRADFVGKTGKDAHQILLNVVGLHAASVEFYQRYTLSWHHMWNVLSLNGAKPTLQALLQTRKKIVQSGDDLRVAGLDDNGMSLLRALGYTGEEEPDILEKIFMPSQYLLKGPIVDDRPLSETEPIRAYTPPPLPPPADQPGKNYIQWLIEAARTSHETLRKEEGFLENKPPVALLYLMLRHALMEGYADAGLRIYFEAQLMDLATVRAAKLDPPFIHVETKNNSESRWSHLYRTESRITDSNQMLVVDHVTRQLNLKSFTTRFVNQQIEALEHLKDASTAQLERLFAEHVDSVSYRLDSWIGGMKHFHLASMRFREMDDLGKPSAKEGIYIGAYGWLEDVRPEFKTLESQILQGELGEIFNKKEEPQLVKDDTNYGYIHAPSPNHAVTAAILRNANREYASEENGNVFAVNLSSERVRRAMSFLEGIRNGQSLAALLGYELERGLHDRYNEAGQIFLDGFIFELRKAFPLVVNRLSNTKDEDAAIQTIEARNVVNGLDLINHVKTTGNASYPFGKSDLPPADNQAQADAINAEVQRLLDVHDAIADLAMAEGVHQVGLGNYDRAAATLDAFGKATFPVEPMVAQTPRSGITLTHRVGIHLETGLNPAVPATNPYNGTIGMTPRAVAEPALNRWLASLLPAPGDVGVWLTYFNGATKTNEPEFVTQTNLQLQALDLLYLLNTESEQAMTELDDRLEHFVRTTLNARPEGDVSIEYTKPEEGKVTFFELSPLLKSLRALTLSSRPLRPTDIALHEEATADADKQVFYENNRVTDLQNVIAQLDGLKNGLANPAGLYAAMLTRYDEAAAFEAQIANPAPGDDLDALKAALAAIKTEIIDNLDAMVTQAAADLHQINLFGILEAGIGYIHDEKRRLLNLMIAKVTALKTRWAKKTEDFGAMLNDYNNLPGTATDDERFTLLAKMERLISTSATIPGVGDTPATILGFVNGKKLTFDTKRGDFTTFLANLPNTLAGVKNGIANLVAAPNPISDFDLIGIEMEDIEKQLLVFGKDVTTQVGKLAALLQAKITAANAKITEHNAAADPAARVTLLEDAAKLIFGDGFRMIPAFTVLAKPGDEWANAAADSANLTKFQSDELPDDLKIDFPTDHWLYGVARVREKMAHWENMTFFAEAFGKQAPTFKPVQLPYRTDDRWLALQFRKPGETEKDFTVDADKLLYTAAYTVPFDKMANQCGLLVDEWTEVIPAKQETTGIAFHYDRPNSEPPQVMLLAMPSTLRGHWEWQDLVDTLRETYEMAKIRAVEPGFVDDTPYARFLPATMMTVTTYLLTISTNLAVNNQMYAHLKES